MIAPTESDIGREVYYHGSLDLEPELGVITSYNELYVFVRYGDETHSKATQRRDLSWAPKS